jgi:hypothetical protein
MLKLLTDFAARSEARESRDEAVVGQIIAAMGRRGFPTIGFSTGLAEDSGFQAVQFATPADPVLHTLTVVLDRKTGGGAIQEKIIGSKATLRMVAEVKNFIADPDDLLAMWRTDARNILRMPMMGQVRLDHQLNTVTATKQILVELTEYDGPEDTQRVEQTLWALYAELRDALVPYKRASIVDDPM